MYLNSFTHAVPAPSITTQPANALVALEGIATFTVVATGDSLTYQWFRSPNTQLMDGGDVFGSDSENLLILNVMEANEGEMYYVEITNGAGTATSNMATLSICTLFIPSNNMSTNKLTIII